MERYQFAAYSWAEIHDIEKKNKTILIPLGSTEQEGNHLPLGVDTYVAEAIAQSVAKETDCLVGPTLPVGYSEWFLEFPGTVSLKIETLMQVLREYISSLIHHGFKKFIFVNGHGGNSPAVDVISREFIMSHDVQIAMVEIWKIANSLAKDIPELKENILRHAGELMTSVMLYLHPDKVNMKKAKVEYVKSKKPHFKAKSTLGLSEFKEVEITLYEKAKSLTESGIMGDPLSATAEKGNIIVNTITSYLTEMVKNF
ncbi:MAG: creatininase family protein [Thermodesulfobacteriota bacterium]|nr:creatininase family protein [Thermodesulfobacteriota bacterium]